ncbi:hypothetical protein [Flammeovirga pacifica]|uniref:Secretion system C-terminal sorting domain-containing protein n=1 Tax=Flammeovirga pacifica TaxID=915059 RepID=A0A1S1Z531_FLAPC|nr:hypothetical protein [Flammeovirga pacifica]OHX68341.1 hypothetical protein NH26_19305 [Flammeovirga pacifica]
MIKDTLILINRRLHFALFFIFISTITFAQDGEMIVTGVYKGSNLYVENPMLQDGSFCINKVLINNSDMQKLPNASAFEIELNHIQKGDHISVILFHSNDCVPRILNPNAIRDKGHFQFIELDVTEEGLEWETSGEAAEGSFMILRYEHNNWVEDMIVQGKSDERINKYHYKVLHHSGVNKYKLKYIEITGKVYNSEVLSHESSSEQVRFYPNRVTKLLSFTRPVRFEILDQYGKVVLTGNDNQVDCTALNGGRYYFVNYDNKTERFFKK